MYVCMYVCMYVLSYVYVELCRYVSTSIHLSICLFMSYYILIHLCVCVQSTQDLGPLRMAHRCSSNGFGPQYGEARLGFGTGSTSGWFV